VDLPATNYWKTGVSTQSPHAIQGLWRPKFKIANTDQVATAGSCFAQHISRHLRSRNFPVINAEPPPPGLDAETARSFGYGIYSARYGNLYAVRQLLQLAQEVFGQFSPTDAIWKKDGRFYDALRPSVEPKGLPSADAVREHRAVHLERVREVLTKADVFVFTLGLTEAWVHKPSGTVYATAPGTIAGEYDPAVHVFHNFGFSEIYEDFKAFRRLMKEHNPKVKFLLTVSPVPLTATASKNHVLVATTYSKSVLRAVAGTLAEEFSDIDYFPSYEMVATPFSRGQFYEDNLRNVTDAGVRAVMRVFFDDPPASGSVDRAQGEAAPPSNRMSREERMAHREQRLARRKQRVSSERPERAAGLAAQLERRRAKMDRVKRVSEQVVCEDELLEAFRK
jgi:hypothetical protein